jgi:hypothetical protein
MRPPAGKVLSSAQPFHEQKGERLMKLENRVIQRIGARELTREEVEKIKGGIRTVTICTITTIYGNAGDESGPETC